MSSKGSESKPDDCITIKNIGPQDVEVIAAKLAGDSKFKVLSYYVRPYSDEKLGFSASHLQLNLTFQKNGVNSPEAVNLFIKALPYDNKVQTDMLEETGIFTKEAYTFNTVIPILEENYKADKWAPICYLAKKDVIVLEDLRTQNYKLVAKFFDDFEMLRTGLITLARYHGCSIVAEAKLNKTSKFPKTLLEYFPEACRDLLFTDQRTDKVRQFMHYSTKVSMAVGENLGFKPDKIKRAIDMMQELVKPSKQHCNVLCHGDLWPNNMMFDLTGSPSKCVLIDFQVCRYAPLALDILQFVHLNTTSNFRQKYERDLIKSYQSSLEETVRNSESMKKATAPTLEEVFAAIDDLRLFGVAMTSLYFPVVLMDSKDRSDSTESPEKHDKFLFGDRTQVTLDYMKKDDAYRAKVEEAIVELAKISERL